MADFLFRFPIPDAELDEIGNWHSPYFFLAFFQARIKLFETRGITQEELREAGFAIVIKVLGPLEFFKPLRRGDVAFIRPILKKLGGSTLKFMFEVYKEESGELYARGETLQVLVSRDSGKSCTLPHWMRDPLSKVEQP